MPLDWGNLPSHFRPKCSIKPPRSLSIIMSIFSRTKYFFPNFLWWNKSPFILLLNTNHQCTSSNVINPLWNFFLALGFPFRNFDILRGECLGNIWKFSIQKSGPILFPAAKSSIKPSLTHFSLLQFQRIGRLSTSYTLFSSKLYIFCLFQIRTFQTPQIVRPRLSSSNEFVLRSTFPMLPWQEQRDGCLNLDELPLWPVVRWDDDLGQDEDLGADCIERTSLE